MEQRRIKGDGKDHFANTATENTSSTSSAVQPSSSNTFYTVNSFFTEQVLMSASEGETSYLTHAVTPTSMVLDLGCTRAMTSWRAARDLMGFCEKNPNCGLWYRLDQSTSEFTFANSESAS